MECDGTVLTCRLDETYYYTVEANDGASWGQESPLISVTVALDSDLDVDGDGILPD